jgi:short-subunit dehydrogenase
MAIPSLKGQRALVTGASSGLGVAFARELAGKGANLVLTARRKDRLDALAEELRSKQGIEVDVIASDLGRPESAKALFDATEGAGKPIDVLINNAGFGIKQRFFTREWERTLEEMQLNMVSLTETSLRFGTAMASRKRGAILNVASIGAYLPTPNMATYSAGKSYVRNFTESLAGELGGSGVRVCCLCPGGTETEFSSVAGIDLPWWKRIAFMSAERCAHIGLSALYRGRRNIVSGWSNAISMFFTRFVPRPLLGWIAERVL